MLDAQPAANAPARPPAVQPNPTSPANADTSGIRSKPAALLAAATALLPNLEAGRALDAKDPARGHERGLRRQRHARRLGLEGRLRSGRGRDGAVHPALRPPHAPRGGRRTRIGRRHARHAGDPGGAGAVPDKAVGGTACPATVLHPLAARLRRAASRRHPARRHRAGALGRHRHARRHGRMRPRQAQRRAIGESPAPERDRRRPRRVALRPVRARTGHPSQRRGHRRLSAGPASHRGVDEPAVFGEPRGPAHPS